MRTSESIDLTGLSPEAALAKAGPGAAEFAHRFLFAMITESDRPRVEALVKLAGTRT